MTVIHGGDIESVAAWSGRRADELLDFSANINPLGPSKHVLDAIRSVANDSAALMRYPEPTYRELRSMLAGTLGVEPSHVAVGNGSAALLDAAIRALRVRRCLLPVPAFSEYRRALVQNGLELVIYRTDPEEAFRLDARACEAVAMENGCDLCVFSNPHNPSGAHVFRSGVLELVRMLHRRGCKVIVDEAFVDYVPESSIVGDVPFLRDTIVLRSLTKFYAIPAIRVGYAVASPAFAQALNDALPSWPVGTIAIRAALAALSDRTEALRTIVANAAARNALYSDISALGFRVFPSAANFLLIDVGSTSGNADVLRERLVREHGIVVRSCSDYDVLSGGAYIRVAVRSPAENRNLVQALTAIRCSPLKGPGR